MWLLGGRFQVSSAQHFRVLLRLRAGRAATLSSHAAVSGVQWPFEVVFQTAWLHVSEWPYKPPFEKFTADMRTPEQDVSTKKQMAQQDAV